MSGLVKPKQYDWKDSNLVMFGSDDEKKGEFSYAGATKFLKFEVRETSSISQVKFITLIFVLNS